MVVLDAGILRLFLNVQCLTTFGSCFWAGQGDLCSSEHHFPARLSSWPKYMKGMEYKMQSKI